MEKRKRAAAIAIALVIAVLADATGFVVLFTYAATPGFQLNLGHKYLDSGAYTEAVLAFNRVLAIAPNSVQAYLGLADAYRGQDDRAGLERALREGLERTGDSGLSEQLDRMLGNGRRPAAQAGGTDTGPLPERVLGEGGGKLSGRVSAYRPGGASDAVAGALVKASGPKGSWQARSDGGGEFLIELPAGEYALRIEAEGYRPLDSFQQVAEDDTTYAEHFMLLDESQDGMGALEGVISDAMTGGGVDGARISLRPGWNNRDPAQTMDGGFATGPDGAYRTQAPVGYYTAVIEKPGYIQALFNVTVAAGGAAVNQNAVLSPDVPEEEIRIVLRWGQTPSDLDSHLLLPLPEGGPAEIAYFNQSASFGGVELANLDVDDTTSYGPETVTILRFDPQGSYVFYVHDYSNKNNGSSTALSYSNAAVSVYVGTRLYQEFQVPTGVQGIYWEVFRMDESGLTPINKITNSVSYE